MSATKVVVYAVGAVAVAAVGKLLWDRYNKQKAEEPTKAPAEPIAPLLLTHQKAEQE